MNIVIKRLSKSKKLDINIGEECVLLYRNEKFCLSNLQFKKKYIYFENKKVGKIIEKIDNKIKIEINLYYLFKKLIYDLKESIINKNYEKYYEVTNNLTDFILQKYYNYRDNYNKFFKEEIVGEINIKLLKIFEKNHISKFDEAKKVFNYILTCIEYGS